MLRIFLALPFLAGLVLAQTANTAIIRGQITDQSGAAVAGAGVRVVNQDTGWRRETFSDSNGFYAIGELPLTGAYRVEFSKAGFAGRELTGIHLRAGEIAGVDAALTVEGGRSGVTVFGTAIGVRSDSPQLGLRFDPAKIDNTPILGRKLTNLPMLDSAVRPARGTGDLFLNNTLFVINGAGRRQTPFVIDGSTADDSWGRQSIFTNVPFASLEELTVQTNSFSAEFGRSAGGLVNVVTRSGTNDFHGDLSYLARPGALQASAPFAAQHTENRLQQVSGMFAGPVVHDRTHFLVSSEFNNENRDAAITSALAPGLFTGLFRQWLFLARLDHQINDRNTINVRANFDRFLDTNPSDAVGALALPSTARTFRRRTYAAQLSELSAISPAAINEARFQFQLGDPITQFDPVTLSTQYARPGVATEGESRSAFLMNHQYQLADTFSLLRGRHSLRFGADAIYSSSGGAGTEFGTGFVLGQFTFKTGIPVSTPTSQLGIGDVQRFTQSFGNPSYNVREWIWALFVQDSFRLRPDLTLNAGLRYERQTFSDDHNNFSPRVGFAYHPGGNTKNVIRGGYGIYYSELRANIAAQLALNGAGGLFTFTAQPGQLGFPTTLAPLPAFPAGAILPPRDIIIRPGRRDLYNTLFDVSKLKGYPDQLLNPYTQLASVGVEREIVQGWTLSVDYVYQHTIRIDRTLDLNAPAPFVRTQPGQVRSGAAADATRPIVPVNNGFRRIQSIINSGDSNYNALQVNLARRFGRSFGLLTSYTWSHTINSVETDANNDPNDANLTGSYERANSLLDQRHRAVISAWWQGPWKIATGTVTTLASARPYNITTGTDNNGDSTNSDRPVINGAVIGRNAGHGSAVYDAGWFVGREFGFSERGRLMFRAEASNLFNHPNVFLRQGVYGNLASGLPDPTVAPALGQPLPGISNVEPGRQIQLLMRLRF